MVKSPGSVRVLLVLFPCRWQWLCAPSPSIPNTVMMWAMYLLIAHYDPFYHPTVSTRSADSVP